MKAACIAVMLFCGCASFGSGIERLGGGVGGSAPYVSVDETRIDAQIERVFTNAFISSDWNFMHGGRQHVRIMVKGKDASKLAVGERWAGHVTKGGTFKDIEGQPYRVYFAVPPPTNPPSKRK
jgi:hypothetical protein